MPQPVVPSGLLVYLKRNVSSEAGPRAAPRGSVASDPLVSEEVRASSDAGVPSARALRKQPPSARALRSARERAAAKAGQADAQVSSVLIHCFIGPPGVYCFLSPLVYPVVHPVG